MKRLLLLALLWSGLSQAQSLGNIAVTSSGVPAGSSTTVVAIIASPSAMSVTVNFEFIDPSGAKLNTASQSVSLTTNGANLQQPYTAPTVGLNGTYSVNVVILNGTTELFRKNTAVTFTVVGATTPSSAPVSTPTASAPPSCYPPNAVNFRITLVPPSYTDWIAASNPYWVVTWFCPSTSDPTGFMGTSMVGYRSELLPNWASLSSSPKAALDALWAANTQNDTELQPQALAQLQATWPGALHTTGTAVYYVIQQNDKFITTQVATAAVGTMCIRSQTVNGMYGVPVASVKWLGSVKPLVVVANCQ